MTIKKSGLWCDLCGKPLFGDDEYWDCSVAGKPNCHACKECKDKYETKEIESL